MKVENIRFVNSIVINRKIIHISFKRYFFNIIRIKFIRYASWAKIESESQHLIISLKTIDFVSIDKQIIIILIVM